jgi:hypothetical protein
MTTARACLSVFHSNTHSNEYFFESTEKPHSEVKYFILKYHIAFHSSGIQSFLDLKGFDDGAQHSELLGVRGQLLLRDPTEHVSPSPHLRAETNPVFEALCFLVFRILDGGQSRNPVIQSVLFAYPQM